MRAAASLISHAIKSKLLIPRWSFHLPLPPSLPARRSPSGPLTKALPRLFSTSDDEYFSDGLPEIRERILLMTEKPSDSQRHVVPDDLLSKISALAAELLAFPNDGNLSEALDSGPALSLLESPTEGAAFVELLRHLRSRPVLALEVFHWRRRHGVSGTHPMHPEEYVKAIALAGRARDTDLAVQLFDTAANEGLKTTSTYNALMAVYMYNRIAEKSKSVFRDLKRDESCSPTIVTYNILLSIYGRLVLSEHLDTILLEIKKSELSFNICTYNTLIAAYITAWKWDEMERTFRKMEEGPIKPDTNTHCLMLRGYAHSGNLEKMEKMYERVKEHVCEHHMTLIRAMICAYCKSSDPERVSKIEELMKYITEEHYRPWLNVLLIRLYSEEGLLGKMDSLITMAFNRRTTVTTVSGMRSIITGYFRHNAVDELSEFVKQAEVAGWRMCRSVYHCKMVMYGRQQRFVDMLGVLDEMDSVNIDPCKKTFWIIYKAYLNFGKKSHAGSTLGLMWKHGFQIPEDAFSIT